MRRFFAALTVVVITVGVLASVSESASAAPKHLGPRVIRVNDGKLNTYVNGALTGSFQMSEFRVRGNASSNWPKKSYGTVLAANGSPLGLPSGKAFRLQANYHDRSLLRNKVSFDLAEQMSGLDFTPDSVFAELFVNGKYKGSYQLTQEITLDNLGLPSQGMIAEFAADGGQVDSDGMRTKPHDPESPSRAANMVQFHVNPFLADLRNGGNWQSRIDMDSFVDHYLVREFTKDKDADFLFSNYYYSADHDDPNATMFMGPVWDFDRSAGNEKGITLTSVASPKGWWAREHSRNSIDARTHTPYHKNQWYNRLLNKPQFNNALCLRWRQTAPIFANVGRGGVTSAKAALGGKRVANNDRAMWGGAGVERPPSRGSWKAEVHYLKRWYKKRFKWMNAHIC